MSDMHLDLRFGSRPSAGTVFQTRKSRPGGYEADKDWDLLLTRRLVSSQRRPYFMVVDGLNNQWGFERKKTLRKRRCPWPQLVRI